MFTVFAVSMAGFGVVKAQSLVGTLIPSTTFESFNVVQGASNPSAENFVLTNASTSPISFSISIPNQPSWFNCGYTTDTLTLASQGVMGMCASVDATKVSAPGTYTTNIVVTGNFSNSPISIPITLTVTAPVAPTQGILSFAQSSFTATYTQGSALPSSDSDSSNLYSNTSFFQQSTFTNISNVPVSYTISVPNQPQWLDSGYNTSQLTANAGQSTGLGVYMNPASVANAPGTYTTNIIITGNFTGSPKILPVTLVVIAAPASSSTQLSMAPSSLSFTAQQGSGSQTQTIALTGYSNAVGSSIFRQYPSSWQGGEWLGFGGPYGSSPSQSLNVQVTPGSLSAGTYSGSIVVNSSNGQTATVPVTLTVTPPANQPSVNITSPNGGEVWQQGNAYQVTWTRANFNDEVAINLIDYTPGSRYGMEYGITNGLNVRTVPGQTTFSWTIPSTIPVGDYYKVSIGSGAVNSMSNTYFTITTAQQPSTSTTTVTTPVVTGSQGGNTTSGPSTATLQQELTQLISLLLQLLQQAGAQGLLSQSQISSALNSVSH